MSTVCLPYGSTSEKAATLPPKTAVDGGVGGRREETGTSAATPGLPGWSSAVAATCRWPPLESSPPGRRETSCLLSVIQPKGHKTGSLLRDPSSDEQVTSA